MTSYIQLLANEIVSIDVTDNTTFWKIISRFATVDGYLFKRGFLTPPLGCITCDEAKRVIRNIHEGSYGSHIGG